MSIGLLTGVCCEDNYLNISTTQFKNIYCVKHLIFSLYQKRTQLKIEAFKQNNSVQRYRDNNTRMLQILI